MTLFHVMTAHSVHEARWSLLLQLNRTPHVGLRSVSRQLWTGVEIDAVNLQMENLSAISGPSTENP